MYVEKRSTPHEVLFMFGRSNGRKGAFPGSLRVRLKLGTLAWIPYPQVPLRGHPDAIGTRNTPFAHSDRSMCLMLSHQHGKKCFRPELLMK
jgi:hypothetical protein